MKSKKITTTTVALLAFGATAPSFAGEENIVNETTPITQSISDSNASPITLGNLDGATTFSNLTEEEFLNIQLADADEPVGPTKLKWKKVLEIIFDPIDSEPKKEEYS